MPGASLEPLGARSGKQETIPYVSVPAFPHPKAGWVSWTAPHLARCGGNRASESTDAITVPLALWSGSINKTALHICPSIVTAPSARCQAK